MAEITYQRTVCEVIDSKMEIREELRKLVDSTNDDMKFSQNEDGSVACDIKYKDCDIHFRITENEVFKYAIQRSRKASEAINEVIQEKLISELLNE